MHRQCYNYICFIVWIVSKKLVVCAAINRIANEFITSLSVFGKKKDINIHYVFKYIKVTPRLNTWRNATRIRYRCMFVYLYVSLICQIHSMIFFFYFIGVNAISIYSKLMSVICNVFIKCVIHIPHRSYFYIYIYIHLP